MNTPAQSVTELPQEILKQIFLLAIDRSPDAVLIEDKEGNKIVANKHFGEIWETSIDVEHWKEGRKILKYVTSKAKNSGDFLAYINDLYNHPDLESSREIEFIDERCFEIRSWPLKQDGQHTLGRVWYFHESTSLKKVEAQLRAEKETFEKYFEVIGRIVLVIDINGKILYLNNRGHVLLGYRFGELVGKNWVTDVLSKNKNYTMDIFLKTVTNITNESSYFEYSLVTRSGKEIYTTWGSAPIKDKYGVVQSFLCTGEDISDLRKAEIDNFHLKQLDKLKDEFLNIVAHELKTPLTSIIALSDLLKTQKEELPLGISSYPEIIFEEGMRLKNVVNRILSVTRFESGKNIMHIEPVSLHAFFSSLEPILKTLNQKKKYSVQIQNTQEDLNLMTDKEQISEVVINLVDNAVKYGADNQTVTISIRRETEAPHEGMVSVEVADQGPGIPPESMHKLFSKFSQLEPSLSRSQEGTGLGLYICKLIIERLGGKIEVKSEVGKGSKFTFYLPLKK